MTKFKRPPVLAWTGDRRGRCLDRIASQALLVAICVMASFAAGGLVEFFAGVTR